MANEFSTTASLRTFMYAGDAVLTLQSEKTGAHFTYRVSKVHDRDAWFLKILTHGDRWIYVGMLYPADRNSPARVWMTTKSKTDAGSACVKAMNYLLAGLFRDAMPQQLLVRHEGRCGRCRRPLTRPDSIDLGLGPDCAEQMGLTCVAA